MKFKFLLLFVLPIASCALTKKSAITLNNKNGISSPRASDDGLSYATAVVITEKSELTGPAAEYTWIKNHYSNYKVKEQALIHRNQKSYDIITIVLANGDELPLYFDISNYFGKF